MRRLAIAFLLATITVTPACSTAGENPAFDDTTESVSLELEFDSGGVGRVQAILTGVGSDESDGMVRRRWIGLDASQTVTVDGVGEVPHAELTYNDATVISVNGMLLDAISAHPTPPELEDVAGWPAVVEYRRVEGSPFPLATSIDIAIPGKWNQEATTNQP